MEACLVLNGMGVRLGTEYTDYKLLNKNDFMDFSEKTCGIDNILTKIV
jgi:hypothetical protein